MGSEAVAESWFSSLRWTSRKNIPEPEKALIDVLAFEVAGLMYRVVSLWQCLGDREVDRLREDIANSEGIKKLVSEDDDYLIELALNEIIENFGCVARSVARLGKKCADLKYHRLDQFFNDPIQNGMQWIGWAYRWKKMERKVKKMNRFVASTTQLSQELEVLAELEQTLRRMQANPNLDRVKVLEFRQKVEWQRQEVRNLREMSPWCRTYDYAVRLLARSLFTIIERIKCVFHTDPISSLEVDNDREDMNSDVLSRSLSFSALMQSSVHPSDNNLRGFSGSLGKSSSKSRQIAEKSKLSNKQWQAHQPSALLGNHKHSKSKRLAHAGPFKGCMIGGSDSPILQSCKPAFGGSMRFNDVTTKSIKKTENAQTGSFSFSDPIYLKLSLFSSKCSLLTAPPSTLGGAALAPHYANVIVLIEKLTSSPHMIGDDIRDDLYNMLPKTIRFALRRRLKSYAKSLASSVYDAVLAAEWSLALARILEWLAPLAHNMLRWQSERSFEKQNMICGANVLLVQTLYFANQAKTEAAITELLVGLNYICRIGREHEEKAIPDFAPSKAYSTYPMTGFTWA